MLTHGRDPGVYAHFSFIGLWPGDADFTVSSIAQCLRDLEEYSGDKSGDLVEGLYQDTHTRPLFAVLLDFEAFKKGYLEPKNISTNKFQGHEMGVETVSRSSFRPLPRHLTLQMDNSGKDNKNQMVMAFGATSLGEVYLKP
ncbi:unnamed protein product [Calypogeia fissa]